MPRKPKSTKTKSKPGGEPDWAAQYAKAVADLVKREGLLPAAQKSRKTKKVAAPKKKRR